MQQPGISAKQLIIIIGLEILLALPFGLPLSIFGIGGVAWIFGGIASAALVFTAYRLLYKSSLVPNKNARKIGQALVGLAIGFRIAHGNLAGITSQLPIFVFLTAFLLLTGVAIGYIYSLISQTNLLNAMLATVPGGVGIMSSIAADYGRDVSLVALVQVIRVTSVVLVIPILARISAGNFASASIGFPKNLFNIDLQDLPLLFLAGLVTLLVVRLAATLKIPAAPFFGALIVGITFNYSLSLFSFTPALDLTPPTIINLIGQALLGISIGEYWGSNPNLDRKTILYALIPVGMTIAAGFVAAEIAMLLTDWDWLTCLLLTAPGGSAEMILVSLALDHNVEIVTAGHLVRLIAIHASLPLWLLLFRYLDNLVPTSVND